MSIVTNTDFRTVDERVAQGRALRDKVPRASHGAWSRPRKRFDPVELIEGDNTDRLPGLIPIRRGRMSSSPFAFFRGSANIMAADLVKTPVTGLTAQICGDAHLSNFGAYASPERALVFDLNDFDETLAGPWEWDIKRLATSFIIAAQAREFDQATGRKLAAAAVAAYRASMQELAGMRNLDIWHSKLTVDQMAEEVKSEAGAKEMKQRKKEIAKARSRDSLQALSALAEVVDGVHRIKSQPPLLMPLRELPELVEPDRLEAVVQTALANYIASLPDHTQHLMSRYHIVDAALKVVGVGSVGTRCLVALFIGRDGDDPLFLQLKEASKSVLEDYLPASPYPNAAQRVVEGQRLMQSASDIFLGWMEGELGRTFYWRQLRDWKFSVDVETATAGRLGRYARFCGRTLARSHARSGDPIAIAAYLGKSDVFDRALVDFGESYAEQNLRDYTAFRGEIDSGRLEADTKH